MDAPVTTATDAALEIAGLLVDSGQMSGEQLAYALRVHEKLGGRRPLVSILRELGLIDDAQLREVLRANRLGLRIGTLLLEMGVLVQEDLDAALAVQQDQPGRKLGEILVENGFVAENDLLDVLAVQLGFPFVDREPLPRDEALLRRVTPAWLADRRCFPVPDGRGGVLLAMADPMDESLAAAAAKAFGAPVQPALARRSAIDAAIAATVEPARVRQPAAADGDGATVGADDTRMTGALGRLLHEAVRAGATDVHFEPMRGHVRVRLRIDGVLSGAGELTGRAAAGVAARLRAMSGAREGEAGRLRFQHDGVAIDGDVAVWPTIHGERVLVRLRDRRRPEPDLGRLGLDPELLARFRAEVLDPAGGLVLLAGPPRSGRSATLGAAVDHLNHLGTAILTVEAPVAVVLPGVSQGLAGSGASIPTAEAVARALDQDPDVLAVDAPDDPQATTAALAAARAGRKVLLTVAGEDAADALLRLARACGPDLPPVAGVLAQRLLRRPCPQCREPWTPTSEALQLLGVAPGRADGWAGPGGGCPACRQAGYAGCIAVHELLVPDRDLHAALARGDGPAALAAAVQAVGARTLAADAFAKAAAGLTTAGEILRVLPPRLLPGRTS